MPRKSRVNALITDLNHGDEYYREVAARTLGELGDVKAVDHLLEAVDDNNLHVQQAVVESLGKLGDLQAHRVMLQRMQHADDRLKDRAGHSIVNARPTLPTLKLLNEFELESPARRLETSLLAEADSLVVEVRELAHLLQDKLSRAEASDLNEVRHGRNSLVRAHEIAKVLKSDHILQAVTEAQNELDQVDQALISVLSGGQIPASKLSNEIESPKAKTHKVGQDGQTMMEELQKLVSFREAGHLTDEEFLAAKAKLLMD